MSNNRSDAQMVIYRERKARKVCVRCEGVLSINSSIFCAEHVEQSKKYQAKHRKYEQKLSTKKACFRASSAKVQGFIRRMVNRKSKLVTMKLDSLHEVRRHKLLINRLFTKNNAEKGYKFMCNTGCTLVAIKDELTK